MSWGWFCRECGEDNADCRCTDARWAAEDLARSAPEDGPYRSELKAWARATGKSEDIP